MFLYVYIIQLVYKTTYKKKKKATSCHREAVKSFRYEFNTERMPRIIKINWIWADNVTWRYTEKNTLELLNVGSQPTEWRLLPVKLKGQRKEQGKREDMKGLNFWDPPSTQLSLLAKVSWVRKQARWQAPKR